MLRVLACLCAVLFSAGAIAHDIRGLLQERALPEAVQDELDLRQNIRLRQKYGRTWLPPKQLAATYLKPGLDTKRASHYESLEGLAQAMALWNQGTTLTVCFANGTSEAQLAVMEVFQDVVSLTNLRLSHMPCEGPTAIRVSFRHSGFSSVVGKDALLIPADQPTMTLENLDLALPLSLENRGIIKHEVMHALGALHEHQHPDSQCGSEILWDVIQRNFGWTDKAMNDNFRARFLSEAIIATNYDKESIMHYQFDPSLLMRGRDSPCSVSAGRTDLSEGDKRLIQGLYPK